MELFSGWASPATPAPLLCPVLPVSRPACPGSACVTPVFREKLECTSPFTTAVHAPLGPTPTLRNLLMTCVELAATGN